MTDSPQTPGRESLFSSRPRRDLTPGERGIVNRLRESGEKIASMEKHLAAERKRRDLLLLKGRNSGLHDAAVGRDRQRGVWRRSRPERRYPLFVRREQLEPRSPVIGRRIVTPRSTPTGSLLAALRLDDSRCPFCGIPLRAVVSVTDDRCTDIEACNARAELIAEKGVAWLIAPEGVTRINP